MIMTSNTIWKSRVRILTENTHCLSRNLTFCSLSLEFSWSGFKLLAIWKRRASMEICEKPILTQS